MKLSERIHLSTTQHLIIYRPEWLTSLPVSPLFLGLPSHSVIWLESEPHFFLDGWHYLKFLAERKMLAKWQRKAVHMGCHVTSGLSLTSWFGRRGLKLPFGVRASLPHPASVHWRAGGPTLSSGCFLQEQAGGSPRQCRVKAEASEPAWHHKVFCCTFKYLIFQMGKEVFEEGHFEVAGGKARYLEQSAARVRPVMGLAKVKYPFLSYFLLCNSGPALQASVDMFWI